MVHSSSDKSMVDNLSFDIFKKKPYLDIEKLY